MDKLYVIYYDNKPFNPDNWLRGSKRSLYACKTSGAANGMIKNIISNISKFAYPSDKKLFDASKLSIRVYIPEPVI